jgi:hypothetical protein
MERQYLNTSTTFWPSVQYPFDAKTMFDNMEMALKDLIPVFRYKGLKFIVKDNGNGKPAEYWFVDDYKAEGDWEECKCGDEEVGCELCNSIPDGFPGWYFEPEFIPQPVLYQSDIPDIDLSDYYRKFEVEHRLDLKANQIHTHSFADITGKVDEWQMSNIKFQTNVLDKIALLDSENKSKFDGTYFVK